MDSDSILMTLERGWQSSDNGWISEYDTGEGVGKEFIMENRRHNPHHSKVWHAPSVGRAFTWIQA